MIEHMSDVLGLDAVAAIAAAAPFWSLDAFELSEPARVDALLAVQQLQAWADAQQVRLLAAMCPPDADELTRDLVATEVGCALRLPPATVDIRLRVAEALVSRLPATLALLEAGAITARHAGVLVEAVAPLSDELAARVEARVLERAATQTAAAFRASVHRAVLAVDARSAEERNRVAVEDRRVCMRPVADGMAELWALLPADGAAAVMNTLNAVAASKGPGETRTADQRRADALVDLAADALAAGRLPSQQGRRPAIQVTVAATTLLGLDDEPGELEGYGAIPAGLARALAADPTGTWRRLVTDPAGRLLDYGQRTYRPPQPLADFVIARDRRCRFPGCNRSARRCHIDHQTPFGRPGGDTAAGNCQALCQHHHRLKHEAGWTVRGDPAGELTWISPTGHRYRSPPGGYPVPR
jgi:hypothetical protein